MSSDEISCELNLFNIFFNWILNAFEIFALLKLSFKSFDNLITVLGSLFNNIP